MSRSISVYMLAMYWCEVIVNSFFCSFFCSMRWSHSLSLHLFIFYSQPQRGVHHGKHRNQWMLKEEVCMYAVCIDVCSMYACMHVGMYVSIKVHEHNCIHMYVILPSKDYIWMSLNVYLIQCEAMVQEILYYLGGDYATNLHLTLLSYILYIKSVRFGKSTG